MASTNSSSAPVSSQKKRALEALEQRSAANKARLAQEEQQKLKRTKKNKDYSAPRHNPDQLGKVDGTSSRASEPSPNLSSAAKGFSASPSTITPRNKFASSTDAEAHPIYSEISVTPHDNLLPQDIMKSSRRDAVHDIVYDIIQKGEEGGKFVRGAKSVKLDNWVLLDNFMPKGPVLADAQAKSLMSHSKRSQKHMSMKQHRKCGSFDLPKKFHHFDHYKPMHAMWTQYINELTKNIGNKQLSERLLTADLHGALILVVECKAISLKGVGGIMIRDTAETFGIVSEDNRFRAVPKAGSVFVLQADCWKITLIGDKLSPKAKLKENQTRQQLQPLLR